MIRTLFVIVALALYAFFVLAPFTLHAVLTGNAGPLFRAGRFGEVMILRAAGLRVRVEGLENIPAGTCLFAANHASNIDPPAITGAIPRRIGILAKRSLFSIPIIGRAFRTAGFIPVNRKSAEDSLASLELAAKHMKGGLSYLIYPEGTRSPDGRLLRFKTGAFMLAIKAGVPVVPIACSNAHRIMGKKSLRIVPGEVVVRFCPAVDTAGLGVEQRAELSARVHDAIAAALPEDQRPGGWAEVRL